MLMFKRSQDGKEAERGRDHASGRRRMVAQIRRWEFAIPLMGRNVVFFDFSEQSGFMNTQQGGCCPFIITGLLQG